MVMNFDNYSTSFQSLMSPMYNVQANYSAIAGGYGNGYGAGLGMGGYYPGMGAGYMGMGGFMTPMNGVGIGQFNADYLIKNDDKYLLEQATKRNNFKWAIPGGHVLTNETAERGLRRELEEELGLKNIDFKHVDTIKYPYNNYIFNIYLIEKKINISDLIFQPDEVVQVKWYTKDEIIKLIDEEKIARGYAYILKKYM